jgi:predicted dinucleotide-binding enzyme
VRIAGSNSSAFRSSGPCGIRFVTGAFAGTRPLAGDDPEALRVAQRLVTDAGFDPVVVGGLARAREFDVGTPVYTRLLTGAELRKALGPSKP